MYHVDMFWSTDLAKAMREAANFVEKLVLPPFGIIVKNDDAKGFWTVQVIYYT